MVPAELMDAIQSLAALMEEETAQLAAPGHSLELAEISTAKVRLVATIEAQTALHDRERPDWLQQLHSEDRVRLAHAFAHLSAVSIVNVNALGRQIDLYNDLMAAITTAAHHAMGSFTATYGAHGVLSQIDQPTPIVLNASV